MRKFRPLILDICVDADDADADCGCNLGWPPASTHSPLIGGRPLQLAGVCDADSYYYDADVDDDDDDDDDDDVDDDDDDDEASNVSTHPPLIEGRASQLAEERNPMFNLLPDEKMSPLHIWAICPKKLFVWKFS